MAEISLHLQNIPGWTTEFIRRTGVRWVKVIDPPEQNPFSGYNINVIGRTFVDDGESDRLWQAGGEGALEWVHRWEDFYQSRRYVHAWEGPNEPHPQNKAERKTLAQFYSVFTTLLHERGLRSVVYNFGVGWPTDAAHWPELAPGLAGADYLGLHEYSAKRMQDGTPWYCLRYRALLNSGLAHPPILITECGIDGGVINEPVHGWKSYTSVDEYAAQLRWYGHELAKDNVLSAFVFTGGPNNPWYDFEVTQELAWAFPPASEFGTVPAAPAPPPSAPVVVEPPLLLYPFRKSWPITSTFAQHLSRTPPSTAPGVDLAAPMGTPILAPTSGKIMYAQWRVAGGRSMWLYGDKYRVYLAHMNSFQRVTGETVRAGDCVGWSGNSGNSTGPHLHVSVQRGGRWVDPEPLW